MTIPKTVELMGNETSADNATVILTTTTLSPDEQVKADEMLKLQQKITQEILNSNLKEKEMNELQVNRKKFCDLFKSRTARTLLSALYLSKMRVSQPSAKNFQ